MAKVNGSTSTPTLQQANARALAVLYRRLCAAFERMEQAEEFGSMHIVLHFQGGRAVNKSEVTTTLVDKL